jgi:hypothetical protein
MVPGDLDSGDLSPSLSWEASGVIQRVRAIIAFVVAIVVIFFTLGRVEVNRTGGATATDDADTRRAAVTRQLD